MLMLKVTLFFIDKEKGRYFAGYVCVSLPSRRERRGHGSWAPAGQQRSKAGSGGSSKQPAHPDIKYFNVKHTSPVMQTSHC